MQPDQVGMDLFANAHECLHECRPDLAAEKTARLQKCSDRRGIEVHLVLTQITEFGRPEAMPVGEQNHGRVPMPIAVGLRRLDQRLDLAGGQVLAGAKLGVWTPGRHNCSIYFGWRDQPQRRFCHENSPLPEWNCSYFLRTTNSLQG